MPVSTDPNDPDFGIETDPNHPDFGNAPSTAGEPQSAPPSQMQAQYVRQLASQPIPAEVQQSQAKFEQEHPVLTGVETGLAKVVSGLVPKSLGQAAELATPAVSGIEEAYRGAKNLYDVAFGGKTISEVSPNAKPFTEFTPFEWGQFGGTMAGQLAMAALIGKGLGREPGLAPAAESVVRSELEKPLVQDRQLLVQPERRFTLAPEPKLAPVPPLEEQVAALGRQPTQATTENPLAPNAFPSLTESGENARRTALNERAMVEARRTEAQSPDKWFRSRTHEASILQQQVETMRKSGQPTAAKIIQDRIDQINQELLQGYQPPHEPATVPPEVGIRTGIQSETARIGGEPNAVEPSNAQVETGQTTQRIESRPASEIPAAGSSNNVVRETKGATARGEIPGTEARQGTEAQPQAQIATPEASAAVEPQRTAAIPAEAPAATAEKPPVQTGISEARTEAELGKGSVEPGTAAELGSGLEHGRNYINAGKDPRLPIRRAQASGLVGKNEVGIVHAELERLRGERSAAAKALETDPTNPELQRNLAQADDTQRAWRKELQPVLTKASDALREAYAESAPNADPATYQGLADIFDENFKGKREITPEMRTAMSRAAKGVQDARTSANGEMAKVEAQLQKQMRGRRTMTPEELDTDLKSVLADEFKDCILA